MVFYKNKETFLNAISFLCACIVPLLVTGPFLPDLFLSLLSLWFLFYSLKNKIFIISCNKYHFIFFAFCLICIISSLLSNSVIFSLKSSLFYFRIGIFALLISYLIKKNTKILNYFYKSFLFTFTTLIFDGYFQFFYGFNILGYPIHPTRVSSFFGDQLILGSYLSRLFPLFLALFIIRAKKTNLEKIYFFSIFFLTDILVFLAGERASFLFINLSSIFIILFISKYKKLRIFLFILVYGVITFIMYNNKLIFDRYFTSVKQSIIKKDENNKLIFFSPMHDGYLKTSIKMFLDKPVLGHGPNTYRINCSNPKYGVGPGPCNTHPHNFYGQLLGETGILGFSFLFGLLVCFVLLTIKHIYKRLFHRKKFLTDYQICLLAGLLITIWPLTTNGNFFNNYLMILYSLQMGFFSKKI